MRKPVANARWKNKLTDEDVCVCVWVCANRAKEWDDVDKAEKEKIELIKKEDGEFW